MRFSPSNLKRIIDGKKPSLSVGKLIRKTSGGRHAYYSSKIGPVRKQLQK